MEINGKVYCFFEQSGTFKNEFRKLGYQAEDYDIQNEFGETDHVIDLFKEIDDCYQGNNSVFDEISKNDLIIAFFPCIYFESLQQTFFDLSNFDFRSLSMCEKIDKALERLENRTYFHSILYKFLWISYKNGIRVILENPSTAPNYLITGQNFPKPTFIDRNRMARGDYFVKPTAYWYINCSPTSGFSLQHDKQKKIILKTKQSARAGICSTERSMISSSYARNFICDFIIGKKQKITDLTLF